MGFRVVRYDETPNPNALKCILDGRISEAPRSFRDEASAQGDALAASLFAVEGVTSVLMNGDWVTVNKRPEAEWRKVKKGVERALKG